MDQAVTRAAEVAQQIAEQLEHKIVALEQAVTRAGGEAGRIGLGFAESAQIITTAAEVTVARATAASESFGRESLTFSNASQKVIDNAEAAGTVLRERVREIEHATGTTISRIRDIGETIRSEVGALDDQAPAWPNACVSPATTCVPAPMLWNRQAPARRARPMPLPRPQPRPNSASS